MKTKLSFNKIFFFSFVVLWLAVAGYNLVKPNANFSENENRYFTEFPSYSFYSLTHGTFMNGVESYVNDRFTARDFWISAQSVLEYASGKRESNGVYICPDALIGKIAGPNDEYVAKNVDAINRFIKTAKLPATLMIVPSASDIQAYKLPIFASPWDQEAEINLIYSNIESADCISLADTLKSHKFEYIYYRTDHHWTTWGAYQAYKAYCGALGLTPAVYNANTVSSDFNGTLYSSSGVRFIKSDVINAYQYSGTASCEINDGNKVTDYNSFYFNDYLSKKDKYAYFLGQNQPIVTIKGSGSGGKLLVFKDSYAHCLAPMLLENYSQVTLVDLRYIKKTFSNYFNINDFDRVLFLYSIDSFVNYDDIGKLILIEADK
jgi:hypothetical protein